MSSVQLGIYLLGVQAVWIAMGGRWLGRSVHPPPWHVPLSICPCDAKPGRVSHTFAMGQPRRTQPAMTPLVRLPRLPPPVHSVSWVEAGGGPGSAHTQPRGGCLGASLCVRLVGLPGGTLGALPIMPGLACSPGASGAAAMPPPCGGAACRVPKRHGRQLLVGAGYTCHPPHPPPSTHRPAATAGRMHCST